jgi:hypothetical protein
MQQREDVSSCKSFVEMHPAHIRLSIVYHYMLLGTPNYLLLLETLGKFKITRKKILRLVIKVMSAYVHGDCYFPCSKNKLLYFEASDAKLLF